MRRCAAAFREYAAGRVAGRTGSSTAKQHWKGLSAVLSDATVAGEGEHKLMSYIRACRQQPDHDPNTVHVFYGMDADLILLALASHEPHFYVIREGQPHCAPRPAPRILPARRRRRITAAVSSAAVANVSSWYHINPEWRETLPPSPLL